jgi:cell wall-associated NlpC family hydrolase
VSRGISRFVIPAVLCFGTAVILVGASPQTKESKAVGGYAGYDGYASGAYAYGSPSDLIVEEAQSHLGEPYGYDQWGWECAEFTRAVYGESLGVWMPADPNDQLYYGWQPLKTKPGDLILYDETGQGYITHVAIYAGGGEIIHASDYFWSVVQSESDYMEYAYVATVRIR